ncbi:MAG: peptidase M48 Ste24p [Candidatus Electrothrix sp. AR3]|nr:peptidase M48 Ste24p [Candidatus Electrothrix sp. AR3]
MLEIKIKPRKITFFFLALVTCLTMIHGLLLFFFFHYNDPKILDFTLWFDLDIERNIPSFYSSGAILICALLFLILGYLEKNTGRSRFYWIGLALIFFFLSMDEAFELHEGLGDLTENYIQATGWLYFPWVIPYGFMTLVFTLLYARFILSLPAKTGGLFTLSGSMYLLGAVVLDMLGGREAEQHGFDSLKYCTLYTLEEFLEMLAIVVLIYAILSYIYKKFGYISITLQVKDGASG